MDVGEAWRIHFGDLPPVAHLLRRPLSARWLRIHSLPDSRRYAADFRDQTELLHRHNDVATEVLGCGDAILFTHIWGDLSAFSSAFTEFDWAKRAGLLDATPLMACNDGEPDGQIVVGGSWLSWSPGRWDDLLNDVARDRLSSVVLYNPVSSEVYAPYDGGADTFLATPDRILHLRRRWDSWLSSHPTVSELPNPVCSRRR